MALRGRFLQWRHAQTAKAPVKLFQRSCSGIAPTVVIPCGDISCSICGALQDSCSWVFLGSLTGSAWHSPPLFCPPFTPTTIFKWLEFDQNIHFLLNPFKAQCGAAVIPLHMLTEERTFFNFFRCRAYFFSSTTVHF